VLILALVPAGLFGLLAARELRRIDGRPQPGRGRPALRGEPDI
jgi:hypothetical protein